MTHAIQPDPEIVSGNDIPWDTGGEILDPEEKISVTRKELVKHFIRINYSNQKLPLKDFVNHVERELIEYALLVTFWNQRQASDLLGIKPTCLNEKIKKYSIRKMEPGGNGIPVHQLQEMVRLLAE